MKGGTIYKEGNKWIWKSPYYFENGIKKRSRHSFDTKEQAEAKRQAYLLALNGYDGNNYIIGLTVRQAYDRWVNVAWRNNEEYISFNTQKNYQSVFSLHILPYVGDLPIDNLDVKSLNLHLQVMADDGRRHKTMYNVKQALLKLFEYCKEIGWIDVYYADNIKIPKAKKSSRGRVVNNISNGEYKKLYTHLKCNCSKFAPLVKFLRYTGVRIEEIAITLDDIKGDSVLIHQAVKRKGYGTGKGTRVVISEYLKTEASYRLLPLPEQAKDAIKEQLELNAEAGIKSKYIFCTGKGNPRESRNVLRAIHDACDDIGIDRRGAHSFRKLYCKTLIDVAGCDWEQARILMGHEDVRTTQNFYYDLDSDDINKIGKKLSYMDIP